MTWSDVPKTDGSGGLPQGLPTENPGQNVSNTFKEQQVSNVGGIGLSDRDANSSDEDIGIGLNEIDEILEKSRDNALPTQTFGGSGRYIDLDGEKSINDWNITKFNIYVKPKKIGNSDDNVDLLLEIVRAEGNSNRNVNLSINKNFEIITPRFSNKFKTCVINALKKAQEKQVKQDHTSGEEIDCQFSLEPRTIITGVKFNGLYNDILETPDRMTFEELQGSKELLYSSYAMTRCTGFRDFVFKIWMAIWGFFHWEFKFEKNNGATNKLCEALRSNNSNLPIENLDNLEVIDTPRDGNCMLWSVLISIFGADTVRDNFSYFRNYVIPWLRGEIAKNWSSNGRKEELTKHLGLGAAPIRPDEMGTVAQLLRCNVCIIEDLNESQYVYRVLAPDGTGSYGPQSIDAGAIEAINDEITIFPFKKHARAVIRQGQKITINNSIPERGKQPVVTNNNDDATQGDLENKTDGNGNNVTSNPEDSDLKDFNVIQMNE
ncbi:MAG: hypothetical protein K2L13_01410 [Opitutales bacterium]|nr:hypothetical protein [Opitutales bacterium]